MYSQKTYGASYYFDFVEGGDNEDIEIVRETNLIDYLPFFYANSDKVKMLMESDNLELDYLKAYVRDLQKNLYVNTATWGLEYYEQDLGLVTDKTVSYEERRERIKSKMRGSGTTTKQMIQHTAQAFSGGEVDVIENFNEYSFIVKFVGIKGIPKNLALFKEMLEEIKPAHLSYELAFTYTVWNMVMANNPTWSSLNSETWLDMMMYE